MYFPNETGTPTLVTALNNEWLYKITQRLIDVVRLRADSEAYDIGVEYIRDDDDLNEDAVRAFHSQMTKPLVDRLPAHVRVLVNECNERGIELNLER